MSSERPRGHSRRRGDPRYVKVWLGDWRRVMVANAAASGEMAELVVVTGPGADVLPWDKSKCQHPPGEPCKGEKGCQVELTLAVEWNKSAPARWSQLHKAASNRVRRALRKAGACQSFRIIERGWEPQKRGVLHQNVVLRWNTPRERWAAALYRKSLTELAPRYGFGFVSQKREVRGSLHAGRYLAKYLSKSERSDKLGIADVAAREDCPGRIAWVDPTLTRATGESIRSCRERRVVWRLASNVAAVKPELGCSLEEAAEIRRVHQVGKLFAELHARARRRRVMGEDYNAAVERQVAELEADARWAHLLLAKAGFEPELL